MYFTFLKLHNYIKQVFLSWDPNQTISATDLVPDLIVMPKYENLVQVNYDGCGNMIHQHKKNHIKKYTLKSYNQ